LQPRSWANCRDSTSAIAACSTVGQPPLLGLQLAQQPEQLLVAAGTQVQGVQFVDDRAEPRHEGRERARPGGCEHVSEYTGWDRQNGTDRINRFGLFRKGILESRTMSPRLSQLAFRRSPFALQNTSATERSA
jgi:hypothetical protein